MAGSCGKENVKQFLPSPVDSAPKTTRYVSRVEPPYCGRIRTNAGTQFACRAGTERFDMGAARRDRATMGSPHGFARSFPENFMRKGSRHFNETVQRSTFRANERAHRLADAVKWEKRKTKPAVPSRRERPIMGLVSEKDYVAANAVEAILSHPPRADASLRWTEKKGFGQAPQFCQESNAQRHEAVPPPAQVWLKFSTDRRPSITQERGWEQLSGATRLDVLRHLKIKWASVNRAYQGLTFTLDTPAKKKRKETLEQLLAQIEKDVQALQEHEAVFVVEA